MNEQTSIDCYKKKVFKYEVGASLSVPIGAKPVFVAMQDGVLSVWFEFHFPDHNPLAFEDVGLEVYGTGHLIPEARKHIGSTLDGPFVWHVYLVQKEIL